MTIGKRLSILLITEGSSARTLRAPHGGALRVRNPQSPEGSRPTVGGKGQRTITGLREEISSVDKPAHPTCSEPIR
jgi:hypothetical protein